MNVLSLFDGMSCGRITLSELGIPVEKYYASEVDKFAIKATMQNFPDTIQLGDVRELEVSRLDKIDLIIGGSPCTNLSMSGKRKGLSTKEGMEVLDLQTYLELKENGFEFEGQSYLFWEYMRIYHELIERGDNPYIAPFVNLAVGVGTKITQVITTYSQYGSYISIYTDRCGNHSVRMSHCYLLSPKRLYDPELGQSCPLHQ